MSGSSVSYEPKSPPRFTMFILDVENAGVTSFHDTCKLCELANELGIIVRTTILGQVIEAPPGTNPHKLYDKIRAGGGVPKAVGDLRQSVGQEK